MNTTVKPVIRIKFAWRFNNILFYYISKVDYKNKQLGYHKVVKSLVKEI